MNTLYTINCPKCKVLEKKLDEKNISFNICKDTDKMIKLNIQNLPVLEVNGSLLNFSDAIKWVNNQ